MTFDARKRATELLFGDHSTIPLDKFGDHFIDKAVKLAREAADARAEEIAQRCETTWIEGVRNGSYHAAWIARATITEKPEAVHSPSGEPSGQRADPSAHPNTDRKAPPPALSQSEQDARTLETAEQVLLRHGYDTNNRMVMDLRCKAIDIRAQAEPDVFEAFGMAYHSTPIDAQSLAHKWFGPLVEVLEKIRDSGCSGTEASRVSGSAIAALCERARKAVGR